MMVNSRSEYMDTTYDAPRAGLETQVAEIIAGVLDLDRVGRKDSFHDFGGTSLQAVRICIRIEKVLGIKVQPASLFGNDVLEDFVADLGDQTEATGGQ